MSNKRVLCLGLAGAALSFLIAVAGCAGDSNRAGDGGRAGESSNSLVGADADFLVSSPPPISTGSVSSLPPLSPAGEPATLRLRSSAGGAALPFSVGHSFRQGHVGSGKHVAASNPRLRGFQASVKNRWRDGSVKFAILSGTIDLQANVEEALSIGPSDANAATEPLGLGELKKAVGSAVFAFGSHGSASWAADGWDTPHAAWVVGSEMSSWLYRQSIGEDRHLVAWMEVRLYRSGAVEYLPWIENGFLLRPSPGVRAGTASFTINGETRFSGEITLFNHTRAVLASGQTLSHWSGSNAGISFRHDMKYLQSTGLVPAYRARTSSGSPVFSRLSVSYTPLAQHDYPTTMGTAGFHPSIGPLPEWDVAYMTSDGDPRAWRAVQVNAYAAGRYGYHYRDENTHRAPRLSVNRNLVLTGQSGITGTGASSKNQYTPEASGGSGPAFANSHMPSIGFMAYLITGRWYFLDEMQLLASAMYLKQTDTVRNFEQGVIVTNAGANTTRGAAWTLRALASVAAMTPDNEETMKVELVGIVQNNIDWYHARYVAQPSNVLGLVEPYEEYLPGDGKTDGASWMEDFMTWSLGNIKGTQAYNASHDAKMDALLAWKYRSIVGRFGPNMAGFWSYRNAAAYTVPYAPSEPARWADGSGPWYANWGEAYAAAKLTYVPGTSLLESYIDDGGLAGSYWGNLQPALAYAVEHGADGALAAYDRMVSASNWGTAAAYFDSSTPVWSVRPRNVAN